MGNMDRLDNLTPCKKARSRRSMILKENRSKRLKFSTHPTIDFETMHNSPTCLTLRQPFSDLTPSFQNTNFQSQPPTEGSKPSQSRHAFKRNRRCSQIDSLGTNLLSNFSSKAIVISNDPPSQSTLENIQEHSAYQHNIISELGSSSNTPTSWATNKPGRGRPRTKMGVPNLALNLSRKFPIVNNIIGTATSKGTTESNSQTRPSVNKPVRGRPRKILGVPNLRAGLDTHTLPTSAATQSCSTNCPSSSVTQPQPTVTKTGRGRPRKQLGVPNLAFNLSRQFPVQINEHQTGLSKGTPDSTSQNRYMILEYK
ncbi:uncharacterized protein LOC131652497 [Vicia villosa]|uniref:uncharacterized protein LOC131652497 n=1 Tax=Vicia villosa TaxID=3911 RepID=UPI00273B2B8E|nr:uncharacterized protein LOC131652497 [Vicia villosa]